MDKLAESIFKVLLFLTIPWFYIYSLLFGVTVDEPDDAEEEETYTLTIGKVVYEFDSLQELSKFVKKLREQNEQT
jgi:hypothetical protein